MNSLAKALLAVAAMIFVIMRMRNPYAYLGRGFCAADESYLADSPRNAGSLGKCKAACTANPNCKYMSFDGIGSTTCALYGASAGGCDPGATIKNNRALASNYASYGRRF